MQIKPFQIRSERTIPPFALWAICANLNHDALSVRDSSDLLQQNNLWGVAGEGQQEMTVNNVTNSCDVLIEARLKANLGRHDCGFVV